MKKLTKAEIEKLAKELYEVRREANAAAGGWPISWADMRRRRADYEGNLAGAEHVLTNFTRKVKRK